MWRAELLRHTGCPQAHHFPSRGRSGQSLCHLDRFFDSVHDGVLRGEAAQGALLDLNADIGDAGILRRGELSLGSRGDPQPVPSGEGDVLSVDDRPARSCQDTVDLLVSPVGMYKGHPCPSGEPVDADLRAGQAQLIM